MVGFLLLLSVLSSAGGVLLLLGLVGLYAHVAEATGIVGLVGFLAAFVGSALGQQNLPWATLLANVGFALFGVACVVARTYPRSAGIVLVVGAVLSWVVNSVVLIADVGMAGTYVTVIAAIVDIIFYAAIGWLGFSLFRRRIEEPRASRVSRPSERA